MATQLSPGYIEFIHDTLVDSFLGFDEVVGKDGYRDRNLIASAAARPFHTVFGQEVWPSMPQKAAALFHSLACNHCFLNGNKRTAVIGLDMFLALNGCLLLLSHAQIYELTRETAQANREGRSLDDVMQHLASIISASLVSAETFKEPGLIARLGDKIDPILERLERLTTYARDFLALQ